MPGFSKTLYLYIMFKSSFRPFSSVLLYEKRNGKYKCVVCDKDVFSSTDKYESGKGWPAFKKAISNAVDITPELSGGMLTLN